MSKGKKKKVQTSQAVDIEPVVPDLTGKQILSILFDTTNWSVKDQELVNFSRDFYDRVVDCTKATRQSNTTNVVARRMDALARMLVGDETCSAIAFDGEKLLLATNRVGHKNDQLGHGIKLLLQAKDDNNYSITPVLYLKYIPAGHDPLSIEPTRVQFDDLAVKYQITTANRECRLVKCAGENERISLTVTSDQHKIPFVPSEVTVHCTLNDSLPLPEGKSAADVRRDISLCTRELPGPVQITHFDPLLRRMDHIFKHLAVYGAVAAKRAKDDPLQHDEEVYERGIQSQREEVLSQSLAWEIGSRLQKAGVDPRSYVDAQMTPIQEFCRAISQDFSAFKKTNVGQTKAVVEAWCKAVAEKIDSHQIETPADIQDVSRFLKTAARYIIDLEKLESFFEREAIADSAFFKAVFSALKVGHGNSVSSFVQTLDDVEDGVHAEMRVLYEYLKSNKTPDYIAITMLCCPLCKTTLDEFGASNKGIVAGGHGKLFPGWKFIEDPRILKLTLGEALYKQYVSMKNKLIKLDGSIYIKSEIALYILGNLGKIAHIDKLGVRSKFDDSAAPKLHADDSDDESTKTDDEETGTIGAAAGRPTLPDVAGAAAGWPEIPTSGGASGQSSDIAPPIDTDEVVALGALD